MVFKAPSRSPTLSKWNERNVSAFAKTWCGFFSTSLVSGKLLFTLRESTILAKTAPILAVLSASEYSPPSSVHRLGTPFRSGFTTYAASAFEKSSPLKKSSGARSQYSALGCFSCNSAYNATKPASSRERVSHNARCHSWLSGIVSTSRRYREAAFSKCVFEVGTFAYQKSLNFFCTRAVAVIHPTRSTISDALEVNKSAAESSFPACSRTCALNKCPSLFSNLTSFWSSVSLEGSGISASYFANVSKLSACAPA
mmetsp:Transcript_9802/g.36386  ORF Transcript_9802/g.36386 Transcript_9802/m.36386 type:complete len:255 (-) Transcript_9802:626-1390(-)